jgi:hypothetical protein
MAMPYVRNVRAGILACTLLLVATSSTPAAADPVTLSSVQALWIEPSGDLAVVDLLASPGAVLRGEEVDFGTESRAVVRSTPSLRARPAKSPIRCARRSCCRAAARLRSRISCSRPVCSACRGRMCSGSTFPCSTTRFR